jgi:hypothetical protein
MMTCCEVSHWWELGIFRLALLDDGLDGVAQQLADDVLEMAEDVWKGRIEMAIHLDFWDVHVRTVGAFDQLLHRLPTVFHDFFGVAAQEDLTHCLLVVRRMLGLREVPGRIERLGEC